MADVSPFNSHASDRITRRRAIAVVFVDDATEDETVDFQAEPAWLVRVIPEARVLPFSRGAGFNACHSGGQRDLYLAENEYAVETNAFYVPASANWNLSAGWYASRSTEPHIRPDDGERLYVGDEKNETASGLVSHRQRPFASAFSIFGRLSAAYPIFTAAVVLIAWWLSVFSR